MESFADDIKNMEKNYSKITFGTFGLKNISKLYEIYNISFEEEIIAYINSRVIFVPLSVSGIIITDKAIYRHPTLTAKTSNRFAISDLCKYIIVQEHAEARITAVNSKEEITILGGMLLGKNTTGVELKLFLKDLRNHIINKYSWAQEESNAEIKNFIVNIQNKIKYTNIPNSNISAIDELIADNVSRNELVRLKAECIFRMGSIHKLHDLIEDVSHTYGQDTANLIKDNTSCFFNNFKDDLQNFNLEMDAKYLKSVYANILEEENIEKTIYLYFLPFICVRLWNYTEYEKVNEVFEKKYSKTDIDNLNYFKGCYRNIHMNKIYTDIKNNTMPAKESLSWTDSLGFTPLHYAIILKNNAIIDNLLKHNIYYKTFTDIINNDSIDENIKEIYNYNVLAAFVNSDKRVQICKKVSADIRALEWEIRKLQLKILNTKKNIFLYEGSINHSDHKEELKECLKSEKLILNDQELYLESLQQKIDDFICQELQSSDEIAQKIKCSNNAFQIFIKYIFSDSSFLCQALFNISNQYKLYSYKNLSFVISEEINLDLSNTTSQNHQQKQEGKYSQNKKSTPLSKPNSGGWFSAQAHNNKSILKKEYHSLSKKYHPDMNSEFSDNQTFVEIATEYKYILKKLN